MESVRFVIGIDVGSFSIGLAAIEIDDNGIPCRILNSVSYLHDGGLDPNFLKSSQTRLEISGVARRTRRLIRKRRKRLQDLDQFLVEELGWKIVQNLDYSDPYFPWKVRSELASKEIENDDELFEKMVLAVRHMARHRGWRNPYVNTSSLIKRNTSDASAGFAAIRNRYTNETGCILDENITVGQFIWQACKEGHKLRGEGGILNQKVHQSDYLYELKTICDKQGFDQEVFFDIAHKVFQADSPKGSAAKRVGLDPINNQPRASKSHDAFQKYRIAALIGNLRIKDKGEKKPLSLEQRNIIYDFLSNFAGNKEPSWIDVAEKIGINRGDLVGTATMLDDGERAGNKPPIHQTNRLLSTCKIKEIKQFWLAADQNERDALVSALSNGEMEDSASPAYAKVQEFLLNLNDDGFEAIKLPSGRAAYSVETLRKLTVTMLENGVDLYEARRIAFNLPPDWNPPAPEIFEAVGNPAVDRVLKIVHRWLQAVTKEWGQPESINIEHIREGFQSSKAALEFQRELRRRTERNDQLKNDMQNDLGFTGRVTRADLWRYQSVQRQNCQCAYCGQPITYETCEMDHIVPRAGAGATNTRENLLAACRECNRDKKNIPFAVWANECQRPGVGVTEAVERVKGWIVDNRVNRREFSIFQKEVISRLKQANIDEQIDTRSIESVAWMANELRHRISEKYRRDFQTTGKETKVRVYRGGLTAEARKAAGITNRLAFLDGTGKSRLDRRHHAVDAAVIAMITPYVSQILAERRSMRIAQVICRQPNTWKEYEGTGTAYIAQWCLWKKKMHRLVDLLQSSLDQDQIPVMSRLRLKLGNSKVHNDTVEKLQYRKLNEAFSIDDIDRASTEALWCALTREPDFNQKTGLPADQNRQIRVNGTCYTGEDRLAFFPGKKSYILAHNGCVSLDSFHHARIYRVSGKKKTEYFMLRVLAADLNRFRGEDLFTVQLPPQVMSLRQAPLKLRNALNGNGSTAEYLGWLVTDDELYLDASVFSTSDVAAFQNKYGVIRRWRVDGFESETRLRLRPYLMSKEGLSEEAEDFEKKILDRPGWLVSVNQLFSKSEVEVIRRDSLGRKRCTSRAHLPICWKSDPNG